MLTSAGPGSGRIEGCYIMGLISQQAISPQYQGSNKSRWLFASFSFFPPFLLGSSHYVAESGLELCDPSTSVSCVSGFIGVCHHTHSGSNFLNPHYPCEKELWLRAVKEQLCSRMQGKVAPQNLPLLGSGDPGSFETKGHLRRHSTTNLNIIHFLINFLVIAEPLQGGRMLSGGWWQR